jgi:PIN domain nuclease of toxin-antitoxin system
MRVLLDTHAFLWFISGSKKLSSVARNIIADLDNEVFLSAASLWEIAIKVSLGKLDLIQPYEKLIPEQLQQEEIRTLPIEIDHLTNMIKLPFHHRDPFDRLIIAQGIVEGFPIVSSDPVFTNYPVKIMW